MSDTQNAAASQNRSRTQKRWHERQLKPEVATLTYTDKGGRSRVQKSRILDLSRKGMSVSLPDRLEIRSFVHVNCAALKLNGTASVRRQLQERASFITGLEFVGALVYSAPPEVAVAELVNS